MLICLAAILTLGAFSVFADTDISESGCDYQISEDGTYVIIIGTKAESFNLKIDSEIDGLPVKEIAEAAFQNNQDIYNVTIPDSVEKIGEAAFRNCQNLVSVTLPSGLKELPFECFRDCKVLGAPVLPETLEKIDASCFEGCTKIGDIKIPASVTEIGYDAFLNCESIRLDCSENAYAAEYAEKFNINTDFEGTSGYFFLMMLAGVAVMSVIAVILVIIFRRHLKKHPNHNPGIYIGRFFNMLGRGIAFVFNLLKKGLMFIVDKVIEFLEKRERKK